MMSGGRGGRENSEMEERGVEGVATEKLT